MMRPCLANHTRSVRTVFYDPRIPFCFSSFGFYICKIRGLDWGWGGKMRWRSHRRWSSVSSLSSLSSRRRRRLPHASVAPTCIILRHLAYCSEDSDLHAFLYSCSYFCAIQEKLVPIGFKAWDSEVGVITCRMSRATSHEMN
jgi:hypothetical protein